MQSRNKTDFIFMLQLSIFLLQQLPICVINQHQYPWQPAYIHNYILLLTANIYFLLLACLLASYSITPWIVAGVGN